MKELRYSANLLKKLRHLHDEMRECVAIYQHLNPHLDLSEWANDELDAWNVFRCVKCDHVLPNTQRCESGRCLECVKPFLTMERDEYESN
jgi:hypothetical protein